MRKLHEEKGQKSGNIMGALPCSSGSRDSRGFRGPRGPRGICVSVRAMIRHTFVRFFNLWVNLCSSLCSYSICTERMVPNLNNSVQAVII